MNKIQTIIELLWFFYYLPLITSFLLNIPNILFSFLLWKDAEYGDYRWVSFSLIAVIILLACESLVLIIDISLQQDEFLILSEVVNIVTLVFFFFMFRINFHKKMRTL